MPHPPPPPSSTATGRDEEPAGERHPAGQGEDLEPWRLHERLVAASPDHIAFVDRHYVYRMVNEAYCRYHGRPRQEIEGHSVEALFGPAVFTATIQPHLDRCLAGEQVRYQAWFDFAVGGRRYMDVSYTPCRNASGEPVGAVVNSRDITDLHQAEVSLAESEERSRVILETAADAILAVNDRGLVEFANTAACKLTGYDEAELRNRPITDLIPPAYRGRHEAGFSRYLHTGRPTMAWHDLAFTILRRDGGEIPMEVSFGEQRVGGRRLFISVLRDVRERRLAERTLQEQRDHIQLLLDSMAEGMYGVDTEGNCTFVNPTALRLLGYDRADELIGRHLHELTHHSHADGRPYPACECRIYSAYLYGIDIHVDDEVFWRRDGTSFPVEYWSFPMRHQDWAVGSVVTFLDISERKKTEARLRQAAKVFESTMEGVVITDLQGHLLAVNQAFSEITGYRAEEALGSNPRILKSGRHDASFYQAMWATIEKTGSWQGEIWNRRKNGETYPEWLTINTVRDERGVAINYVGVFTDISQLKHSEAQLEHMAHHDPLTDLPNRLLLSARLEHAIQRAHRDGTSVAVLFVDLDRFKTVNDSLGHPAGDRLLQDVAHLLSNCVRGEDTVARLGGDEFVVMLEGLHDTDIASGVARKILAALARPFEMEGQAFYIGASIGISLFPSDGNDPATLLKNADAAMYRSKEDGRNVFRYYSAELTRSARERLRLEAGLRLAVREQQFVLHYQPQIDVSSGTLVGAEALIRWQHPESGLISPLRFIPLAEETGLILPLGEWVLTSACEQLKAWLDAGLPPFTLAVNLSPRQFRQPNLARQVHAILDAVGLDPTRLELEITEGAIMEQGESAVATLHALKDLGIRLAIDDFGTGYSSLAYLRRFPIDTLKIDQSFMRDIPRDIHAMEIAATIIAMARNLHMHVLAEGVESDAQLAFLQGQGCDIYQGYLFSPPVTPPQFRQFFPAGPA